MVGMRKPLALWVILGVVACQPLYGNRPDNMPNPRQVRPKDGAPVATAIEWDTNCDSPYFEKPTALKPNRAIVQQHVATGEQSLTAADSEEVPAKKSTLVITAINEYKQALAEDPYDSEATYGLAVAYATVYKKQCALDLINRLVALRANPKFESDAKRMLAAAYSEPAFKPFKSALP